MTAAVPIEEDLKWGRVTGEGAGDSSLELGGGEGGVCAHSWLAQVSMAAMVFT